MSKIKTKLKQFTRSQLFFPVLAFVLLMLFNLIFTKDFFRIEIMDGHLYGNLIDILNRGSSLILLTIGMTLVIATGGIDISVGAVVAISGALTTSLIAGQTTLINGLSQYVPFVSLPIAIIIGLLAAALCGAWNGFLVTKLRIQAVVATMILMTAGRGIAQLITSGNIITVTYDKYFFIGGGFLFGLPFSIFIVLTVFIIIMYFVKKTSFGMFLESVGLNSVASKFSGINADRIIWITYIISGVCAGIAGLIISSEVKSADANNAGLFIELDAILSTALGGNSMFGGKFSIPASVFGALVIQTLTTTIYALGVAPEVTMVVKALVVIVICLIKSESIRKFFTDKSSLRRKVV
jgi:ribose/xylose/arabinose/galactoside ABC-type transport system permease subunit